MANLTAHYTAMYEGYVATATMPDGSTKQTRVFPRCDFSILQAHMEGLKKHGEELDFVIEWRKVTHTF